MTKEPCDNRKKDPGFLHFAGFRYWTASLLPALVGTTLPFWLCPPEFSFRWFGAIEFLFATVLMHTGFSFLQAWFQDRATNKWTNPRLLMYAIMSIVLACIIGLHINSNLHLNKFVHEYIFIIFGISVIFVGVFYVVPKFNFCGEIIIAYSFGLLPVLGAYIVQAGDITRRVYLASIPLIIATGLWAWIDKLASRKNDEKKGRKTMVMLFEQHFSGRYIVLILSVLLFISLLLAVLSASLAPLALIALLSIGLGWKIVVKSWNEYSNSKKMLEVRKKAFILHFITGIIITITPLVTFFM
ncbi:MAG: prenyltransferase [Candidatus Cloacimonadota bacterium]|nr:prenyltransferase [Candidatus Cloacimonadota bacterium]